MADLKDYKDPITTTENITELHHLLVQTCLDYMVKNGLTDIDEVQFCADGLSVSYKYGYWTPATDSSLTVVGVQVDEECGYPERRCIGFSM